MFLFVACDGGNLQIVKYLLEKGADIHVRTNEGFQPIHAGQ